MKDKLGNGTTINKFKIDQYTLNDFLFSDNTLSLSITCEEITRA